MSKPNRDATIYNKIRCTLVDSPKTMIEISKQLGLSQTYCYLFVRDLLSWQEAHVAYELRRRNGGKTQKVYTYGTPPKGHIPQRLWRKP